MIEFFLSLSLFIQIIIIYIIGINVITFFYFGFDKLRSRLGEQRVSEKTLWLLSLIGGSVGALLGMKFFRHKTKKLSFQAGMAMVVMIQVGLLFFIFFKNN